MFGIWLTGRRDWLREFPAKVEGGERPLVLYSSEDAAWERAVSHLGYKEPSEVHRSGAAQVIPFGPPVRAAIPPRFYNYDTARNEFVETEEDCAPVFPMTANRVRVFSGDVVNWKIEIDGAAGVVGAFCRLVDRLYPAFFELTLDNK